MRHAVRTASGVVLRAAALLALCWGTFTLVDLASGEVVGANIGAGLAGFAALVLGAGFAGAVDGRYRPPLRRVVATWAAVAVLASLGLAVFPQLGPGPSVDVSVYLTDLLTLGWYTALLVLVPAVMGAALGDATRPTRSTGPTAPALRPPGGSEPRATG